MAVDCDTWPSPKLEKLFCLVKREKMPRLNDRKRTAYHEAGHSIIAWHYNIPILGVSLVKGKHTNGESRIFGHFRRFPNVQVHELERELDVNMAGTAAEEKLTGKKMTATRWGGNDYVIAVKIAEQWAEQTGRTLDNVYLTDIGIDVDGITGCLFSSAFLDEFGGHVRDLVTRPHIWKCIEVAAQELLKKTALSGEEVSDLIAETWEAADGYHHELALEAQRSSDAGRPWGEW